MPLFAELHSHSHYSEGEKIRVEGLDSPKELVKQAKQLELEALAITDHNKFEGALEAEKIAKDYNITIIKGEEIETREDKHIIGLGLNEFIPKGHSIGKTIDLIREQGAIALAPHPFDLANKGIRERALECDTIEVFNAINLDRFSNRNAKKFAEKHSFPRIAGSDAHCKEMIGYGLTEINAEGGVSEILKAIKKGKTIPLGSYVPISVIQYWALNRFHCSYHQVLDYIYQNYSNPKRWMAKKLLSLTKRSPGKIDYLFKGLAYFSFGTAMCYSALKNVGQIVD